MVQKIMQGQKFQRKVGGTQLLKKQSEATTSRIKNYRRLYGTDLAGQLSEDLTYRRETSTLERPNQGHDVDVDVESRKRKSLQILTLLRSGFFVVLLCFERGGVGFLKSHKF